MAKFSVDTNLFRELGELLVGRDSTALVELIKNSYDADATAVVVHASGLDDRETGLITVQDNGIGISASEFTNGFLRIAARGKETGDRRSPRFGRRYTGAKGIGRLAAHKLASRVEVISTSVERSTWSPLAEIQAQIDWDQVEQAITLDEIPEHAVTLNERVPRADSTGTTIKLSHLRRAWTPDERLRFVREAQSTRPPNVLLHPLPPSVIPEPLLFTEPSVRTPTPKLVVDPFAVELSGEFDVGEGYFAELAELAHWIVEIDAGATIRYAVAATERYRNEKGRTPDVTVISADHVDPGQGPFFQARILIREGATFGRGPIQERWKHEANGIRVFMEGFRVLPYGEQGNDWLEIDRDYTRRSKLTPNRGHLLPGFASDDALKPQLVVLSNRNYLGGVFLTANRSSSLRMLVNREGFVPDAAYYVVRDIVKDAINLATRVRAAASFHEREERKKGRRKQVAAAGTVTQELAAVVDGARQRLGEARALLSRGGSKDALAAVLSAEEHLRAATPLSAEVRDQYAIVHVLATIGSQLASFVHEVQSLLSLCDSIEKAISGLRNENNLAASRRRLVALETSVAELRRALERQASYLTDVVTPDARRRRSRQSLSLAFDAATHLFDPTIKDRNITVVNRIHTDLKSPPMFRAELVAVFSNLLSNAIKAAGRDGQIRASGRPAVGRTKVRVQNTGRAVRLPASEKLFEPFVSTTTKAQPILGQGMGLGLTITRRLLDEYGARITFVEPDSDYATAIEIAFEGA